MPPVARTGSRNTSAHMEYVVQAFSSLEALGWYVQLCQGLLGLREDSVGSDVLIGGFWGHGREGGTCVCAGFALLLISLADLMRCSSCGPIQFRIWGSSLLWVRSKLLFASFLQTLYVIKWGISGGRKGTCYVTWEMQPIIWLPQAAAVCWLFAGLSQSMYSSLVHFHSICPTSVPEVPPACHQQRASPSLISVLCVRIHTVFIISLG